MTTKAIPTIDVPIAPPQGESGHNRVLDQLCINTIRTLAMDAVQQANSGHPDTPMALAPVVYTLWQRFLRFDPEDPIWPNRDRFVLSNGHASMLLYATLHLAGVKAVDAKYERLGEPAVTLEDIKLFRQLDSKCPGHPEYHLTSGVRDDHGATGPGLRHERRYGDRGPMACPTLQPPEPRDVRLRRLCAVRRRRYDGGRVQRSGLDCRSPDAREPLLDLRQQPGDHRGPHEFCLQRGRRRPFPRLRLERAAGRRRERHGTPRGRNRGLPARQGRADAHHCRKPYRLWRPAQARYQRRPWRAARRGGDPPGQAQLRLARGRQISRAERCARAFPRRRRPTW